jgi:predicted DsbA family dithiol-disulfide isomerase
MFGQAASQTIAVDIVSDVVCPWCFLGKKHFEAALAMVPDLDVEVTWRPFQLDPTVPAGGRDYREHMKAKFGDLSGLRETQGRLVQLGADFDIAYAFDSIERAVNTLDAHRLIRFAGEAGVQDAVVERLFRAYFEEGVDIGDRAELARLAGEAGLDEDVIEQRLSGDDGRKEVETEIATAQRVGVTGVPCFIIASKYAVSGAQPPEALAGALRQVAAEMSGASTGSPNIA